MGDSDRYVFSVSATTRSPRTGEVDGVDYHFLDIGDFEKRAEAGELVEWASVHGCLYGTPRAEIDDAARRGEHVVLDIDVQGARQIRASIEDAVLIFVLPPSVDIMMARLKGRGTEGREDIARRLRSALTELQALKDFGYVVVNDDLDECISEIRAITEGQGEVPDSPEQDAEQFRTEIVRILRDEYDEN